jgi:hypothetical protein
VNHADIKIETLVYIGEKQRYSFETHVSNFKQAHLDLQKAGNEPDGRTKAHKFLQSIKAPEMQTAVAAAQTQDAYLTGLEATINYLRRFVFPASTTRTVAATSTSQVSGDKSAPPKPLGTKRTSSAHFQRTIKNGFIMRRDAGIRNRPLPLWGTSGM